MSEPIVTIDDMDAGNLPSSSNAFMSLPLRLLNASRYFAFSASYNALSASFSSSWYFSTKPSQSTSHSLTNGGI